VHKWIESGKLQAVWTPGGHRRITVEEFRRFQATYFTATREEAPRILVVDDDPAVVEAILEVFRLTNIPTPEVAYDGYKGLLHAGLLRPHLLILDLHMPSLNGLEVCRRIKEDPAMQATKVLAITGYTDQFTQEEALRCGADAFLAKPFSDEELLVQVTKVIGVGGETPA